MKTALMFIYTILLAIPLFVLRLVLIIVGLIVVPIAIPMAKFVAGTTIVTGNKNGFVWMLKKLPKWAWLWSNDHDGTLGDKRGKWDAICGNADSFINQVRWLCIRNPVNNLRHVKFIRCPLHDCSIHYLGDEVVNDRVGEEGFQIVWAKHKRWKFTWPGIYYVKAYGKNNKCVRIRIGWKIRPVHADRDYGGYEDGKKFVGMSITINPYKSLHSKRSI